MFNKISTIKQEFETQYNFSIESVIDFDKQEKYYFFVLKDVVQKVSKNGKNYWSLELGDGGSSVKMVVWEDAYDRKRQNGSGRYIFNKIL